MILPDTAETRHGRLYLGGCDTVALAREFGTPLYVFDEATIRARARSYVQGLAASYPNSLPCYGAKAFVNPWLARLLAAEGFGLDVVSAGEILVAQRAGFPMAKVHFHGNNKLPEELALAIEAGVGRIVIDNLPEIDLLEDAARARGVTAQVWLRVAPGIEAHTHEYLQTGGAQSKFGIAIQGGQADDAVRRILAQPHLRLLGLHAHIGSQIFELEPYRHAVARLLDFSQRIQREHGAEVREISPGGGLGIQYTPADDPPDIADLTAYLASKLREEAANRNMELPLLVLEPGRSVIGPACVTLYTVGSIKQVPGGRTYVAVDGGMADNIRPALYQAKYHALAANDADPAATQPVTIAGKYCESGDILIDEVELPAMQPGDVLAVPASGAYSIPLASNYNLSLKPAIVAVRDGQATLIRRRETYDDLLACEVA